MTGCAELLMPDGPLFWLQARSESGIEKTEIGLVDDAYLRIVTKADGSEDISAAMRRPCLVGKKRIVLLIDEDTGSSAELLAAALLKDGREDKRVIAIGKQTHGKGFGQAFKEYEDGSVLKVTFCHFYSADDVWFGDCGQTTAAGVKPDLDVEGRYEQFQAAMSFLNQLPVIL
jgi:C-terminal processing protease CtpA/Prc